MSGPAAVGWALVVVGLATPVGSSRAGLVLGLDGGVQVPVSDWTQHPYAIGIDQFAPGFYARLMTEGRLGGAVSLLVGAAYGQFDVKEWVSYAREQGVDIDASAEAAWLDLALSAGHRTSSIVTLKLTFGVTWFIPNGRETFGGATYEYSFLRSRLGMLGGLELDYRMGRSVGLALGATLRYVPNGVQYASGLTRNVIVVPVTIGLRFGL